MHQEHDHKPKIEQTKDLKDGKQIKKLYILEHLECANCAAKMERKIQELPEVEEAILTYTTKQLQLITNTDKELLDKIQSICSGIEADVIVTKKINRKEKSEKVDLERKRGFIEIGTGAILFILGIILEHQGFQAASVLFVIAYIILGWEIVLTAIKNITKGHVFDENFLMSLATIAAFIIGDFAEAVGVMLFYRVGELFEDIAVEKSRRQIMDAVDMRPEVVNLLKHKNVTIIPAEQAKVDDIVLVRPGDRIPLDGVIIDGESRIDTSPVTGEPVPVKVGIGSQVISGCVNTSGLLQIKVEKILEDSMVSRILDSVENAAASKPQIDRFITKFARIYTPIVVLVAVLTAIIPSIITGNWNHWVYTAITFLVISCPCALVLSVPLAFFAGIGAGSKQGILFKGGLAIEALNHVKAIVMDKTGTITEGNFEVQDCITIGNYSKETLLSYAASCESSSTHPIGISIVSAAKKQQLNIETPIAVEEISGKGIRATLASGEILCGNMKLMEAFEIVIPTKYHSEFGTEVLLAYQGEFLGYILIADTVKSDAVKAVKTIKSLGIRTVMLTGDAKESAQAVAKHTGLDEVYAKLLPEDKLNKLVEIRQVQGAVMFVGDGINDAPVLAGADVGAAMGSGADAAIEAADVVFMTSSMEAIPQSLSIAKRTNSIAKQNVIFALAIKALVMILGFAGYANMWMAVFADTGVAMICVLNAVRILYKNKKF